MTSLATWLRLTQWSTSKLLARQTILVGELRLLVVETAWDKMLMKSWGAVQLGFRASPTVNRWETTRGSHNSKVCSNGKYTYHRYSRTTRVWSGNRESRHNRLTVNSRRSWVLNSICRRHGSSQCLKDWSSGSVAYLWKRLDKILYKTMLLCRS